MSLNKADIALEYDSLLSDLQISDCTVSLRSFGKNRYTEDEVYIPGIKNLDQNVHSKPTQVINHAVKPSLIPPIIEKAASKATKKQDDVSIYDSHELSNLELAASQLNSLNEIQEYLEKSEFCDIKKLSQNTVLYDGVLDAKIMLIGEAPGEEEDKLGKPFVGRSGKLLDNVLQSIGISRTSNLYITNTVFWRPPANRKPTTREKSLCRPFVARQIELLAPSIIILCGSTAIESLAQKDEVKMSDFRGRFFEINVGQKTFKSIAIYHPSYLMRNPSSKKLAWEDMLLLDGVTSSFTRSN